MTVTFGLKPDEFNLDNIRSSLLEAERLSFDKGWLGDHIHETIITEEYSLAEVWTTLSYLSGQLDRLRLGISILNINWRHPVLTAKAGANLDIISRGRFELVLGLGLREEEYICYGFPFGKPSERIERCKEFLSVLKNLWTLDSFSFRGRFYNLRNAVVKPKPIQIPYPPIAVAAQGKNLIEAMPQMGAGWYVAADMPIGEYKERVRWMNNACRRKGVDPQSIKRGVRLQLIIDETDRELEEKILRSYENSPFNAPKEMTLTKYREKYLAGTPDMIRDVIKSYIDLGVSDFIITFMEPDFRKNDFRSIELFGKEVINPIKSI
ncbi:MAG: LLM class flavin-dependent oxidoreductase [Nitrososphaeria archaeon]|nr:LLM class flavin-dependent oxidoreductase [Nitrososphaeria archaeon]NIQ32841.1 LLM class flavin-dependent oxidoreductase [Nitrososphaeria archaeon]